MSEETLQALDSVAESLQRDKSFVINQAVDLYLSLNEYHCSLIEKGLRQDDAGEVIDHQTLMNTLAGAY